MNSKLNNQYKLIDEVLVKNDIYLNDDTSFTQERLICAFNELINIPNLLQLLADNKGLSEAQSGIAGAETVHKNKQKVIEILSPLARDKSLNEKYLCKKFLESYNELRKTNYVITDKRERPDFLVSDTLTSEKLGIEITRLYSDEEVAKILNGRSEKPHGIMIGTSPYIDALNKLLFKKAKKVDSYDFESNIILVIFVPLPVGTKEIFDNYENNIKNKFFEIFLLFSYTATQKWELMQIK